LPEIFTEEKNQMVGRKSSFTLLFLWIAFAVSFFSSCLIKFTLTFDANGGRFPDGSFKIQVAAYGRTVVIPQEPARDDDLVFIGWYLDREGIEPADELLSKSVTSNMTFYAKWGYIITFNPNGGTDVESIKAAPGEPIEAPQSEKSGYALAGWFRDDGTFEEPFDFSEMPPEHLTLYAKWELFNPDLCFRLIDGGEKYEVSIGQCLDDEIRLPAVYEGKPVTTIPADGFNNGGLLSSIFISESIESIAPDAFELSPNLVSISVHLDNGRFLSIGGNLYRAGEEGAVLMRCAPGKLDTCFSIPDKIYVGDEELTVVEVIPSALNDCKDLLMVVIPRGVTLMSGPIVNENVQKAVFITEAPTRPDGWAEDWLGGRLAIMGCEISADLKRVLYFKKGAGSIINPPQTLSFSGQLIGDYLLEGWYTREEEKVGDLLEVPDGTELYARWLHKSRTKVLEPLWEQIEYIFTEMFGEIDPYFVEINSKETGEAIGKALLAGEGGYPVLAFECLSRDYYEVYDQVSAINEYPINYTKISNTNVYVADDCSMHYLLSKNVKKVSSSYYSKDGTALLYTPTGISFEAPQKVKHIGDRAFFGSELKYLSLSNVESIGTMAFAETKISSLELNEGLLSIGRMAFMSVEALTKVTIPASVAKVDAGAFFGCKNLSAINVAEGSEHFKSIDGHLYSADGSVLVQCAPASAGSFSVPEGVERIADMALASCRFDTVEIGAGVLEIGNCAFIKTNLSAITVSEDNTNYKSVYDHLYSKDGSALIKYATAKDCELFTIPEGVAVIMCGAFSAREEMALKNVILGSGVSKIEAGAFKDVDGAFSFIIPDSVSVIGRNAFLGKTLYCEAAQLSDGWDPSIAQANAVVYGCTLSQDKSYVVSVEWQGGDFSTLVPFRQGYAFKGWYSNPDFSGQGCADLGELPAGTYYAKWAKID
jgi:uncharacterized repeat protein (TIGR02543 family)